MVVFAPSAQLFPDYDQLYAVLQRSQKIAIEQQQPQIISISLSITAVDIYSLLPKFSPPKESLISLRRCPQHSHGFQLVAGGTLWLKTLQGDDRFSRSKQLSQQLLKRCHRFGDPHPLAGPRIFCSFSFFPTVPVDNPFPATTLLLPRWLVGQCRGNWIAVINQQITAETQISALMAKIDQAFHKVASAKRTLPDPWSPDPIQRQPAVKETETLKQSIGLVLQAIRQHRIQKIVLSERCTLPLSSPLSLQSLMHRLHQIYPDCTTFSFSLGQGPTFLGASPERLLSLKQGRFVIDALAGSIRRGNTPSQDKLLGQQLLDSAKDRHEHALVVSAISQRLIQLGIRITLSSVPYLLKLANIQHLHTPIQGAIPNHLHPLDLVAALHPTPAVAGTPTDLACEHIRRLERCDRSLYAAPFGWIDNQANGEFIVGIRSALLDAHQIQMFAGAGIVKDSDPDSEVAEIQLKLKTLLQALILAPHP